MDFLTAKQQAELEVGTLEQVGNALRAAISWRVKPKQLARKISTVRFVAQSFQRYLERLVALEEHDGYMSIVEQQRPQWSENIEKLRNEHEMFRRTIRRIITRLERITPQEQPTFENFCRQLLDLTQQVDRHNRRESELLEDAFDIDEGGEG